MKYYMAIDFRSIDIDVIHAIAIFNKKSIGKQPANQIAS